MGLARSLARFYGRHCFTILFGVLLLAIAGHGFVASLLPVANPLEWLLGASLVAVVFTAPPGRLRWLLGASTVAAIATRVAQELVDHPGPTLVTLSLMAITCLLAAGVAVRRSLASGPVNVEHICGALDAYLLAGLAFGAGYWLMETVLPGSFSSASGARFTPARAFYFSFVTQSTLGFGDIVPVTQQAQGVVISQGIGGQMYLAVLVARLVSLYSAQGRG